MNLGGQVLSSLTIPFQRQEDQSKTMVEWSRVVTVEIEGKNGLEDMVLHS